MVQGDGGGKKVSGTKGGKQQDGAWVFMSVEVMFY